MRSTQSWNLSYKMFLPSFTRSSNKLGRLSILNTSARVWHLEPTWVEHIQGVHYLMAHFHYGENRTKLVGFKGPKKYFPFLKLANLARFFPKCKHGLKRGIIPSYRV
jgi:hypothetical protein